MQIVSDEDITFTISDSNFLEMLLLRIRGETIKYATYRKRQENENENRLKSEIQVLEKDNNQTKLKTLED